MIREFLSEHYQFFIDSSPMVKAYLCFLIAAYPESLFHHAPTEDLPDNYLRFILENLNIKDEESPYLVESAIKSLDILFSNQTN